MQILVFLKDGLTHSQDPRIATEDTFSDFELRHAMDVSSVKSGKTDIFK